MLNKRAPSKSRYINDIFRIALADFCCAAKNSLSNCSRETSYVHQSARISNVQTVANAADVRVRVLVALVSLSLVLPLILKLGAELLRGP